jgi:hypothetical protein
LFAAFCAARWSSRRRHAFKDSMTRLQSSAGSQRRSSIPVRRLTNLRDQRVRSVGAIAPSRIS